MADRPSIAEERAAHEAASRARRAELDAHLATIPTDAGRWLVRTDLVATVVSAIVVAAAAVLDSKAADVAVLAVSSLLGAAGVLGFAAALWRAAMRSRVDELGVGGLFFLAAAAPRRVALRLNWCLAVQVVIPVIASAIRPYSPVAFGTLIPLFGLAVNGLWTSRHGWFPPRRTGSSEVGR